MYIALILMKRMAAFVAFPTIFVLAHLCACRDTIRQDMVIPSAVNSSHAYRATVIQRQYYVDGKFDTSPTTYVILDKYSGTAKYENSLRFKESQIIM